VAHGVDAGVLLGNIVIDLFVVETGLARSDVVALTHLEVLTEVLVTAPPISVHHTESLVAANLMEVRVANVILLAIGRETTVLVSGAVHVVGLSNTVAEMFDHLFLLVLNHNVEKEALVQMENKADPHEADTVLLVEDFSFPVGVCHGVFEEPCDVLECSPFLGLITGFLVVLNELAEITIGLTSEGAGDHIGAFVNVRHTVEETLDTGQTLTEVRFRVFTIVEILSHFNKLLYMYY